MSSDGDDQKGPKIKPQKNPFGFQQIPKHPWTKNFPQKNSMPNFQALNISRKQNKFGCTLFAEIHGQDTWALP